MYEEIKQTAPEAPVAAFVGTWQHAGEVAADYRLPYALARIGLLPRYWLHHDPYRWRHRRWSSGRTCSAPSALPDSSPKVHGHVCVAPGRATGGPEPALS